MKRSLLALPLLALPALAQNHDPSMHHHSADVAPTVDSRIAVVFPTELRIHTLANMRDHLLALQEIQVALSKLDGDLAADVAEQRLGLSSLRLHGAHEVVKYMPPGMQNTGTAMHRSASRFATASREAAATGDLRPALAALGDVMAACVACHNGYRIK